MLKHIISRGRAAVARRRLQARERALTKQIARVSNLIERYSHDPRDLGKRAHYSGMVLPRLSLQLADVRMALRTGMPPCTPVLAQVLPPNIAVLRRRERAA